MTKSKKECYWRAKLLMAALIGLALGACGAGGGAGALCSEHSDCSSAYQCLSGTCVSRCESTPECGDGYQCSSDGTCEAVISQLGDPCQSEWDCGTGQSCKLINTSASEGTLLSASCQPQGPGLNVGGQCQQDDECFSSICSLGRCSQLCRADSDCPAQTGCTTIPKAVNGSSALFKGCLQNSGVLSLEFPINSSSQRLQIPVPESAQSFAVVTTVDDTQHFVGVRHVVAPSGALLFQGEFSFEEQSTSKIRHILHKQVNTLLVPNRDTLELETGFYQVSVAASLANAEGTAIPKATVFYKMDSRRILDLHFYFLNLQDHPCKKQIGSKTLSAQNAINSNPFQEKYLKSLKAILRNGDLQIGQVTYTDIDRADLDGIVPGKLGSLFERSTNPSGIAIFLVRSLSPDGVLAQSGGTPGPPRSPGTPSSGVAISMDTLCYRSWESLARITGHSVAGQMGLWNNRDPQGILDPISDSGTSPENLMFFGEFGGTELSEGQKKILGLYPGLR